MIESHGRLIDTAVRPLADNAEIQLAAAALLEETLQESRGNADEAIARWDKVDAGKTRPCMKWVFIAVLAALSAWVWLVAGREGFVWWYLENVPVSFRYDSSEYQSGIQRLEKCVPDNLTDHERLLLFGDTSKASWSESMKVLWDSEPENPAYFMEFAFAHLADHRDLPSGFLETARRLAPENSWPVYFAAAVEVSKIVKADRQSWDDISKGIPRKWTIRDQAKFVELLVLFHQASLLPKFDTYQVDMLRKRMSLAPMDDYSGYQTSYRILWGETPREYIGSLLKLVAAKARQCAENGSIDGYQSLLKDYAVLERRWSDSETDDLLVELRMWKEFRDTSTDLHRSAEALRLSEESKRFAAVSERFKQQSEAGASHAPYDALESQYSMLLANARRYSGELPHPPWTPDDLKPGRFADHELLSRAGCLAAWTLLGIGLTAAGLFRFRLPVLLRRLSVRIGSLLRPSDYAWIIGLGVLLPYAYTMILNRLTPLGGRDLGIYASAGLLPAAQFLGMALLMWIASLRVARWRLEKRAGLFGFGGGSFDLCLRAMICMALFIPASGFAARADSNLRICFLPLALALFVFPVLWLLIAATRAIFASDKVRLLASGVTARVLVPAYAVAMLLLAAAAPVHKAMERHWFRKDTIMRMDPAFPALSPYEYQAARQSRKQTRQCLGLEP